MTVPNRPRNNSIPFFLGTVARYHPGEWMAILQNETGGGAPPLLATAAQAIETDYAREFARQIAVIVDDPHFLGSDFGDWLSQGHSPLWTNAGKSG